MTEKPLLRCLKGTDCYAFLLTLSILFFACWQAILPGARKKSVWCTSVPVLALFLISGLQSVKQRWVLMQLSHCRNRQIFKDKASTARTTKNGLCMFQKRILSSTYHVAKLSIRSSPGIAVLNIWKAPTVHLFLHCQI